MYGKGNFEKLKGVIDDIFGIGNEKGLRIQAVFTGAYKYFRLLFSDEATYAGLVHADVDNYSRSGLGSMTEGDVADFVSLVWDSFDGASAPDPDTKHNETWMCTTAGGGYSAGTLYKSELADKSIGAVTAWAWVEVDNVDGMRFIVTHASYTTGGTPNLLPNSIYAREGGAWVYKGGAGVSSAGLKVIKVPVVNSTVTSTTSIGIGNIITRVQVDVTDEYSSLSAMDITVGGTNLLSIGSDSRYSNIYGANLNKAITTAGVVTVTMTGAAAGTSDVYVFYVTPEA